MDLLFSFFPSPTISVIININKNQQIEFESISRRLIQSLGQQELLLSTSKYIGPIILGKYPHI